jgi:hypothetical protein
VSDVKTIIAQLEALPDRVLDRICGNEILDTSETSNCCKWGVGWWELQCVIEKVHEAGLFPEFFGCLLHCMGDKEFREICGIPKERLKDLRDNDSPFLMGMGLMVQSPRKIVIAAIAAKRLHDISPEACVGSTSSPDGTRLHHTEQKPFTTVAVDVQKDGAEVEVKVNNCLGCGHFKCTDDCPPGGEPNDA